MKSLRDTRKAKGLSLIAVEKQLGLNNVQLHDFESGKHSPGYEWRARLEAFYNERINFLDTPNLKVAPKNPPADWTDCEREFRWFVRCITSMPEYERDIFIITIKKHLNKILTKKVKT
jgi:transcriptional regulator with XRE-family HTH domain